MPVEMHTKYLDFIEVRDTGRTKTWAVSSTSGAMLGRVVWYGPWRQYAFWPEAQTIFDTACLDDVSAFIAARMNERKRKTRGRMETGNA
jgi:hypothetical protein